MIYVVYKELSSGLFRVKSKQLANSLGLSFIREFGNFYEAVEYAQFRR